MREKLATDTHATELKAGCFVITILAISLALLIYIGVKKDLFAERASYYVVSTTGEGIEEGMAVRLKGFRIGQVNDVTLESIDVVRTEIRILKEYMKWFTRDAILSLERPIIGGGFMKLTPGSPDAPVLSPGSTLTMQESEDLQKRLEAEVQVMLDDVKLVVKNVRDLSEQIMDDNGTVQTILANLEDISNKLAADEGILDYVTRPGPARRIDAILANTEKTTASLSRLAENADARIDDLQPLQREMQAMVEDVGRLIREFHGLRSDIDPLVQNLTRISEEVLSATQNLSSLRRKGEYTIRLGNDLMQRLKTTWPLSRGESLAEPPPHPLP